MIKILPSQNKYSLGRMLIIASIWTVKASNRQQITSTEMLLLYGVLISSLFKNIVCPFVLSNFFFQIL
jgi:hypothetical protein